MIYKDGCGAGQQTKGQMNHWDKCITNQQKIIIIGVTKLWEKAMRNTELFHHTISSDFVKKMKIKKDIRTSKYHCHLSVQCNKVRQKLYIHVM